VDESYSSDAGREIVSAILVGGWEKQNHLFVDSPDKAKAIP
jgi:hypothetical protein